MTAAARHLAKKLRREARERELAAATERASRALGKKLYGVVYADPPWAFRTYSERGKDRAPENRYPTMSLESIKALPIPAADDCALFLWVTVPLLPQGLEVMAAWGFAYKSTLTWVKPHIGLGFWTRNRIELLLIGTRGNVPAPAPGEQPPQVIQAARGRHSEKPEQVAAIIERLFPNVPRIELFARASRAGWDVWGNEMEAAA